MSPATGKCPDCSSSSVDRREFIKSATAIGVAAATAGLVTGLPAVAKEGASPTSETLVQQLYGTLNDKQKALCAFPFDHELRSAINNNWHITETQLTRDFDKDQQALITQIFNGLHSPEWVEKVMAQIEHDGTS